jgi:hypothetical protein
MKKGKGKRKTKFKAGQVAWHINAQRYIRLEREVGKCKNFRCEGRCWKVLDWQIPLCDTKFRPLTKQEANR